MKKWVKKYEVKGNNNEKFVLIIGICLLLIYNYYFMYDDLFGFKYDSLSCNLYCLKN